MTSVESEAGLERAETQAHEAEPAEGVNRVGRCDARNRTADLLITNQLLYQLSYISVAAHFNKKFKPLSTTIGWAACKTPLCANQVLSSAPRDNA